MGVSGKKMSRLQEARFACGDNLTTESGRVAINQYQE